MMGTVVMHRSAYATEIRVALGTTVTQGTVRNRLLQGQIRARRPVACFPPTPSHCSLRGLWFQARTHRRTERRSVIFLDENRFYHGASDGRVLVRRRPGERL
ncbi:transposable element Tc1 transposase [Trichonephila clavipes]|nr:transposable element Tc1 transposase [Trichonephila clavipes]